jgi:hypothetical protein
MENNIINAIESISIYIDGSEFHRPFSKNTIVVAGNKGSTQFPIAYIKKPKHLNDNEWTTIKNNLIIKLTR